MTVGKTVVVVRDLVQSFAFILPRMYLYCWSVHTFQILMRFAQFMMMSPVMVLWKTAALYSFRGAACKGVWERHGMCSNTVEVPL